MLRADASGAAIGTKPTLSKFFCQEGREARREANVDFVTFQLG
jgi:hypothetical protein